MYQWSNIYNPRWSLLLALFIQLPLEYQKHLTLYATCACQPWQRTMMAFVSSSTPRIWAHSIRATYPFVHDRSNAHNTHNTHIHYHTTPHTADIYTHYNTVYIHKHRCALIHNIHAHTLSFSSTHTYTHTHSHSHLHDTHNLTLVPSCCIARYI